MTMIAVSFVDSQNSVSSVMATGALGLAGD